MSKRHKNRNKRRKVNGFLKKRNQQSINKDGLKNGYLIQIVQLMDLLRSFLIKK